MCNNQRPSYPALSDSNRNDKSKRQCHTRGVKWVAVVGRERVPGYPPLHEGVRLAVVRVGEGLEFQARHGGREVDDYHEHDLSAGVGHEQQADAGDEHQADLLNLYPLPSTLYPLPSTNGRHPTPGPPPFGT